MARNQSCACLVGPSAKKSLCVAAAVHSRSSPDPGRAAMRDADIVVPKARSLSMHVYSHVRWHTCPQDGCRLHTAERRSSLFSFEHKLSSLQGSLPVALAAIIIGRDVLLVTGACVERCRRVCLSHLHTYDFHQLRLLTSCLVLLTGLDY